MFWLLTVCSMVILSIFSIAQIAVGALYHNDCPKQHYIPIYLEVMGGLLLLLVGLSCLPCVNDHKFLRVDLTSLTRIFFFFWFIIGNVWIYSIYEPNYNKTRTDVDAYCNKTLYLFAFWTTNVNYIIMALFFLLLLCRQSPSE